MLSAKEASRAVYRVFGMTRPGIEPWSLGTINEQSNQYGYDSKEFYLTHVFSIS